MLASHGSARAASSHAASNPCAAAQIEEARAALQQALREDRAKPGRRELAAREVPGEAPGRAVVGAGGLDERAQVAGRPSWRRVRASACAQRDACAAPAVAHGRPGARGSTSRITGAPLRGARRVTVVQQQDVAAGEAAA